MLLDDDCLKFDIKENVEVISKFIRKKVKQSGASGVVLGLSGGVDSSLSASLCTHALGKERVLGILIPVSFTPKNDVDDALLLA